MQNIYRTIHLENLIDLVWVCDDLKFNFTPPNQIENAINFYLAQKSPTQIKHRHIESKIS